MMPPDCTRELVSNSDVRKDNEAGTSPNADITGTGEEKMDKNTDSTLPSLQIQPNSGIQDIVAEDFAKVSSNFKTAADRLRAEAGCVSKSKRPVFRFQPGGKEPLSPVVVGVGFIGPCSDEEDDPMRDDFILQKRCYHCGAIKSVIVDIGSCEVNTASTEKSQSNTAKRLSENRQQKVFTITMPCPDTDITNSSSNNNNLESKMRWPFCKICQTQLPVSPLVQGKNGRVHNPAPVPTLDRVKGHHHPTETPLFRLAIAHRRALAASQTASSSRRCGACGLPARTVLSVSFLVFFVIILVVAVVLSLR